MFNCRHWSPPCCAWPQVTTDPSARIAAKADCVAWICCTPLSWSWTAELSPPSLCMTPGNDWSIFQNCSKGPLKSGLNLLHTAELILNCHTVTATFCITPGNDWSIFQDRSKGPVKSGSNLLHIPKLILNWRTVTAIECITPGDDRSICQESQQRHHHLWLEPAAHPWADIEPDELSPPQCASTPGCDGSICQNRSKGPTWGLNPLHTPELISNCRTVTAIASASTPGNDRSICQNGSKGQTIVAWICCAPFSWSWTAELSPP